MPRMSSNATIRRHVASVQERKPLDLGLFHIVFIFLACSFIGLAAETLVSFAVDGRWESRAGFVFGPFSPLYGLGAVLMTLAANPLRDRPAIVQFLVTGAVGGALEYFTGWFLETRYGIVAWSYIDQPFNFHGHTCLAMCAVWGLVGTVWAISALPRAVKLAERIPEHARRPFTMAALAFIAVDSTLTLSAFDSWFWRLSGAPVQGPVQEFCAAVFPDSFMSMRFETMSVWTVLASR